MKAGHFSVTMVILSTLLIRLLIVFSTGLLLLQDTFVENPSARLVAFRRFTGERFRSSAVSGTAALIVAGTEVLGLDFPHGTSREYAYQQFNLSRPFLATNSTLTGSVDVFTADLECQPATLQHYRQDCIGNGGCEEFGRYLVAATPDCVTEEFLAFSVSASYLGATHGTLASVQCTGDPPQGNETRLAISVGKLDSNESLDFVGLICKPFYQISKQEVSLFADGSLQSINWSPNSPNHSIAGVSPLDIFNGISSTMVAASTQFVAWNAAYGANYEFVDLDTFFTLMNMTAPQDSASELFNETLLYEVGRSVYRSLSVQIANQYLNSNASDDFTGNVGLTESRLLVHDLSLRAMEGTLAALIILGALLCLRSPAGTTPLDPGSIIGQSSIIARSLSFVKIFDRFGCTSTQRLKLLMTGWRFQTVITAEPEGPSFEIQVATQSNVARRDPQECLEPDSWWQPFSVTILTRVFILTIPLVLIGALEAVYQASDRHDGIANVTLDNYVHYSWVYIPAIVMLATRAVFDTVDFTARVFQPYCSLHLQSARPEQSMSINYLSKTSIHVLYTSLFRRHLGVTFTSVTMLMAPFLTIVVSGLFTAKMVHQTTAVTTDRLDWFNASVLSTDVYATNKGNLVSSLVMETDLDYPSRTVDDLVFPKILFPSLGSLSAQSGIFQARVPTLRGALNCSRVPSDSIQSISWDLDAISVEIEIGHNCGDVGHGKANQTQPVSLDFTDAGLNGVNNDSYFGVLQTILTVVSGCAPLIAVYGHADGASTENINIVTCFPLINQVDVDTTFSLPSNNIISTSVDESSTQLFANSFEENNLGISAALPAPVNSEDSVYDSVFSMLVRGGTKIQGTPITDFMGTGPNIDRFTDALSHLFGVVYAQVLNSECRTTTSEFIQGGPSSTIEGNLTTVNLTRLQQQATSTRILEGLLAAMTIFVALSFLVMKNDKVIPLNPCSIAASAALLAGSRMLKPRSGIFPPGSEWHSNREQPKWARFYQEQTFSLKWWRTITESGSAQMRYGIDMDDIHEEDMHRDQRAENEIDLVSHAWVD